MSKTVSRSVLGSMNDMINLSKVYLEDVGNRPLGFDEKIK